MIPIPASPPRREKMPSPITTIPAVLKNSGAYRELANEIDVYDRSMRTGNVPRAKKNMMVAPLMNDPEESAWICIDCVNPHGRKNVPNPIIIGANV